MCVLSAGLAWADCSNPSAPGGTSPEAAIVYNANYNVLQFCDGDQWIALGELKPAAGDGTCSSPHGVESQMLYNADHKVFQFCNGEQWIAMIGPIGAGCNAPSLCPNVGDVCDDGNVGTTHDPIFAGFMADSDGTCRVLYVTDDNQSEGEQWKAWMGDDDIAIDSIENGASNQAQVTSSTDYTDDPNNFPAFQTCEELSDGGFDDWYLPAQNEFDLLWVNSEVIDANAVSPFASANYWTSTESSNLQNAKYEYFGSGTRASDGKTVGNDVRCVRSTLANITSPGGCTVPAPCPNVGDVCDDNDAGTTNDPIFAGFMIYGTSCQPLYVTNNNQSGGEVWKSWLGDDDISVDSDVDGRSNQSQIVASPDYANDPNDFAAFNLCEELTDGGFTDWYLPSFEELDILWKNAANIDTNAAGPFTGGNYWSSTERDANTAWYEFFGNGNRSYTGKTDGSIDVRCVRRD